jgi:GNAT superfamily N-acetyltransferase
MEIQAVESKKDFKEFILFPYRVYKNDPHWVPLLESEVKYIFSEKNPFWQHARKCLFLARQGKEVVGRIAGIVDWNYIEFQNSRTGFFGFFECLADYSVAAALLDRVKNWLKGQGMDYLLGPTNPSTNDEMGFLAEGFEMDPCLMMPYNPPYYLEFMERYQMQPAKELYAYSLELEECPRERIKKVALRARKKVKDLSVRRMNLKNFNEELERARQVYNNAWEKNWGFVPWTEEEFSSLAQRMKSLFLPETSVIAEVKGKPVGILIAVPDYNQVLKRMKGKMNLPGIIKFLWYRNKIDVLRLMVMGVAKEYRKRGIEIALYWEAFLGALEKGYKKCEISWVLEDNILTRRAAEMMGAQLYKKYRLYQQKI